MDADFWVPFEGGHLPMKVIKIETTEEGGHYGPRQVSMIIEAVSMGSPVFSDPEIDGPRGIRASS
jgi:hypothetical protein